MEQRDYIIDKIDNAAQFIASLITNRKTEAKDQATLDQTLSDLTGLDNAFFTDSDSRLLKAVLPMLADNNVKKHYLRGFCGKKTQRFMANYMNV